MTVTPERIAQLESQLAQLEASPQSALRELALEALTGVLQLYGDGLARILELAPQAAASLSQDELVGALLLLHGLHPIPLHERVESALASVRPYLATHGGDVDLIRVSDGIAHVRLQGTCNGCPSSEATLKSAIEKAIFQAAPEVTTVEAEAHPPQPKVIALESLVCPLP